MDWQDLPPIYWVIMITLILGGVIGLLWLVARKMLWVFHYETF